MKRETLTHPKTYDLAARLGCSRPEALGFLTLLWDFTGSQAPQSNIGKWADGAIARACDWSGEPGAFIEAMVGAGWVDRDEEHRLLIHHWEDHCERWVKAKLEKLKLTFITRSTEPSVEPTTDDTTGASPPRDQTKPNQTKPTPTKDGSFGAFTKLVLDDLKDDARLTDRYRRIVTDGLPDTAANLLNVFAAAERSLENARDPPAMFRSIVEKRQWNLISQAQEDRGRERLKRFRGSENGTPAAVAAIAGAFRSDFPSPTA